MEGSDIAQRLKCEWYMWGKGDTTIWFNLLAKLETALNSQKSPILQVYFHKWFVFYNF